MPLPFCLQPRYRLRQGNVAPELSSLRFANGTVNILLPISPDEYLPMKTHCRANILAVELTTEDSVHVYNTGMRRL